MIRAVPLLLLAAGCPCGTLPGDTCGPPAPDSCNSGETGAVATVEVGSDADPFVAYHDLDQPHVVFGGQGAAMMGIRLRLTGNVPACLAQSTAYEDNMASGSNRSPVNTYKEADGSYTTRPLWIPGYFPSFFTVHVDAGGQTARVHLGTPLDMQ